MSALSADEPARDLSAVRSPCVVDLDAYRARAEELDRIIAETERRVCMELFEANATARQIEDAQMFAKLRLYKGDTPILAASAAVKWAMQPQESA